MPLAHSQVAEQEAQLREALIVVKYSEEQVPNLQKQNEVIADIPQPNESIARQSGVALYRIICTCTVCTYTYTRYMAYRTLDLVYT